jgi:hypothetical protein
MVREGVGGNGFTILAPLKFDPKNGLGELFFNLGVLSSILFLGLISRV